MSRAATATRERRPVHFMVRSIPVARAVLGWHGHVRMPVADERTVLLPTTPVSERTREDPDGPGRRTVTDKEEDGRMEAGGDARAPSDDRAPGVARRLGPSGSSRSTAQT